MKFAMIPINRKYDENNNLLVRRVLISYTKKYKKRLCGESITYFTGTKIVETDNYFKESHSHTYKFEDKGYTLLDCQNELKEMYPESLYKLRLYHAGSLVDAILFKAKSNEEAIEIFNNRKELR